MTKEQRYKRVSISIAEMIALLHFFLFFIFIMSNVEHVIEVNDLCFNYGGPPILDHLNFKLKEGSRCILVGANGAGKTSLLRILAGKRLIHGHVRVLGRDAFLDAPPVSLMFCKGILT